MAKLIGVGEWQVDSEQLTLSNGKVTRRVTAKCMALLEDLARQFPSPVATHELLERVWPGVIVGDNTVHRTIANLRKVVDEGAGESRLILTIPRRGYRLAAEPDFAASRLDASDNTAELADIVDTLLEQADLLVERDGDSRKALGLVRQALTIDPGHGEALALKAELLYRVPDLAGGSSPRGWLEQARDASEIALNADPGNGRAWYARGQVLATLDLDFQGAAEAFDRALAYGFHRTPAAIQQAALLLWSRRYDDAAEAMQRSEHLSPSNASVKEFLARCLFHCGAIRHALTKWDEARQIEPKNRYILHMSLRHSLLAGNVANARRLLEDSALMGHLGQQWAFAWMEMLEGKPGLMRRQIDQWDRNGRGSRILPCLASHAAGAFENHARWWARREYEHAYVHTTLLETSVPGYWEQLGNWGSSDSHRQGAQAVASEDNLLDQHAQRMHRLTRRIKVL